ncbi:hypothetical protein [Actinospica sp.]|uniref:hypothetical protein n=1 Tax=Actinospica sp. TaxID=1872142 RepID=UPI002B7FD2C2|nr:hypothetical protein [Actinospica sp.]HWG23006.1 hypothetical protein [Actinospica sp.]
MLLIVNNQANPERLAAMPVTASDQDRVLVRHRDVGVAVVGVRAFPQAVMFQLLVKAWFAGDEQPNLAFGMPHLLRPGNFEFGAEHRDATGQWQPTVAHFAGGGGGGGAEPEGIWSYEFKWWVALAGDDLGLRLWCVWEERGVVPRSIAEFDMDRLLAASRASQPMWTV